MAVESSGQADCRVANSIPIGRCVRLALLLAAELAWLTIDHQARHSFGLLARTSAPVQVLIACAAALVIVGTSRLRHIFERIVDESRRHDRYGWALAGHALFFAGLVAVISGAIPPTGRAAIDNVWRSLLLVAAVACWGAAVAPWRFWLRLMGEERIAILGGATVGLAAWGAGQLTQFLWKPLGYATFVIVEQTLQQIYPQVVSDRAERLIGTPGYQVIIAPECSGYEGIGLMCVFLAAFFWLFRDRLRFPQAWALWPLAIATIWVMNALRIALLVVVGTSYSPAVASRGFHSQAGWLFFNAAALGLMAGALRLRRFSQHPQVAPAARRTSPVAGYLIPCLVLVAMNMLVGAFSDGGPVDRLYPLKVLVTGAALWRFRSVWMGLDWNWSWWAFGIGIFVFAVWRAIATTGDTGDNSVRLAVEQLSTLEAVSWLAFRVIGSVVTVSLAEELAFRGYLLRRLVSDDFERVPFEQTPWWAVGVSSLMFGLMHGRWLAGTIAGVCYALVARRRRNLGDAILAHSVTNACVAADVLLFDSWWLW